VRWWKWLIWLLFAIIAGLVASTAAVLATLDNDDYRKFTVDAIEKSTGGSLAINGSFDLQLSTHPTLTVSDLLFTTSDKDVRVNMGQLIVRVALWPLLRSQIVFDGLLLKNLLVEIEEQASAAAKPQARTQQGETGQHDGSKPRWIIPEFKNLDLKNIALQYKNTQGENEGSYTINHLALNARKMGDEPNLSGSAELNGVKLKTSGRLDMIPAEGLMKFNLNNLKTSIGNDKTLFINLSGNLTLNESGMPNRVQDIDLAIGANAETMAFIRQWDSHWPGTGPLHGKLHVLGNSEKMALKNVNLTAGDKETIYLEIQGGIQSVTPGRDTYASGVKLELNSTIRDTSLLGPFLNTTLPDFGEISVYAMTKDSADNNRVQEVEVSIKSEKLRILQANGTIDDLRKLNKTNINTQFEMDANKLLGVLLEKPLPETDNMGTLAGKFVLTDSTGNLGIEQLKVSSRKTKLFSLSLDGKIGNLKKPETYSLKLDLKIPEPQKLSKPIALKLPITGPVKLQGSLLESGEKNLLKVDYSDGKTTVNTSLVADLSGDKPSITGTINAPAIILPKLKEKEKPKNDKVAPTTQKSEQKKTTGINLSEEPMELDWLDRSNLDIDIAIGTIEGETFATDKITVKIVLKDGNLHISPAIIGFHKGNISMTGHLQKKKEPTLEISIETKDLSLQSVFEKLQKKYPVTGDLIVKVNLDTKGASPHELGKNLNGNISAVMETGTIPLRYLELLTMDILGWFLHSTVKRGSTDIDCAILRVEVKEGIAAIPQIYMDTDYLLLKGSGEINFQADTMDVNLVPKQKKTLFDSASPITIKGPISDPSVSALSDKSALKKIGMYAFTPFIVLPKFVIEHIWGAAEKDDKEKKTQACIQAQEKSGVKQKKPAP